MSRADIIETERRAAIPGTVTPAALQYLAALVMVVFASAIAVGVDDRIAIPNVSLVYVVPVVIAGAAFGDYERLVKVVGEAGLELLEPLRCNPDGSSRWSAAV